MGDEYRAVAEEVKRSVIVDQHGVVSKRSDLWRSGQAVCAQVATDDLYLPVEFVDERKSGG